MRLLAIGLAVVVVLYVVASAVLFFGQRSIVFPAPTHRVPWPAGFAQVSIITADGLPLQAAYRPAPEGRSFSTEMATIGMEAQQRPPTLLRQIMASCCLSIGAILAIPVIRPKAVYTGMDARPSNG